MQNPKGSFGLPDEILQEINRSKQKATGKSSFGLQADEEPKPKEKAETKKEEPTDEELEKNYIEQTAKLMKDAEEMLGVVVTPDDVVDALFNSSLLKRDVIIIPGKLHATFKYSLTINEANEIDREMAEAMEFKMLETGYKNLRSQHIIARGVIEMGKPGKLKEVGPDTKSRFIEVGKMSALLIEILVARWNVFVFMVTTKLKEIQQVKKP